MGTQVLRDLRPLFHGKRSAEMSTRACRAAGRPHCVHARALLPAGISVCFCLCLFLSVSLCLSATRHPHARRCHASQRLPCLWAGSADTHDGGAGAAWRRRRSGAAATRERGSGATAAREQRSCGELRHDPYRSGLGCKVRAELLTEHGTTWWCSYALPYFASREALRAEAGGRSCAM